MKKNNNIEKFSVNLYSFPRESTLMIIGLTGYLLYKFIKYANIWIYVYTNETLNYRYNYIAHVILT